MAHDKFILQNKLGSFQGWSPFCLFILTSPSFDQLIDLFINLKKEIHVNVWQKPLQYYN